MFSFECINGPYHGQRFPCKGEPCTGQKLPVVLKDEFLNTQTVHYVLRRYNGSSWQWFYEGES